MFGFGKASGTAATETPKVDTTKQRKHLSKFQDPNKSVSKLNEVTVGSYNKDESTTQALEGTENGKASDNKEEEKTVVAECGDAVKDAISSTTESVKELGQDIADACAPVTEKLTEWGEAAYDQAAEWGEAAYEFGKDCWEVGEAVYDYVSDMYDEGMSLLNEACAFLNPANLMETLGLDQIPLLGTFLNNLSSAMCAQSPYPQCASCPNRAAITGNGTKVPNYMKNVGDGVDALEKGLTDAAMALLGCPGMVEGLKTGLLTGDMSYLTGPIKAKGPMALTNACVKTGASAAFGVVSAMVPEDAKNTMGYQMGELVSNSIDYDSVCAVVTGFGMAGSDLFTAGSLASNGDMMGAYKMLKDGSSNRSASRVKHKGSANITITKSQDAAYLVANNADPTGLMLNMATKCQTSAKSFSDTVSTTKTRTRGKFTSYQLHELTRTGISEDEFKRVFCVDEITTKRRAPKCTKVKKIASASAALV